MPRLAASPSALLAELVSRPSVHPEGDSGGTKPGEAAVAEWTADYLRRLGADVEIRPLAAGRPNVVAVFEPARRATASVAFVPHLDTVGVQGMTVPAFSLTRQNDRWHGRGACDTKGPMAALLWALRRWINSPARRRGSVRWIVAATAGEEQGSLGAKKLLDDGFRVDFAVALEPTNLRVVHAAKGFLRVWIETPGKAAHGSRPDRGINAIYRALPFALALRDEVAPAFAARVDPLLGPASLNLGVIAGGRDLNIVPGSCRLGLDIRLHAHCTKDDALAMLEAARIRHCPEAKISVHAAGPSFVTSRRDPWAQRLRRVGRPWAVADWFCDANFFAGCDIPAVAFGPGRIAHAHTRDEFITGADLRAGAAAFHRFLLNAAN